MGLFPEHVDIFKTADSSAHAKAAKELLLITAITAAPFAVGLFAFLLVQPHPTDSRYGVSVYLEAVFLRGQLFLISVSYLATSLHRLFNSDSSYRRPDIINVFSIILFGIIGVFYGINPTFAEIENPIVKSFSLLFFVISVIFYYYIAVLSYERPAPIQKTLEVGADDLAKRLGSRREEA